MATINVYVTDNGLVYFYPLNDVATVRYLVNIPEQISEVINQCLEAGDYKTYSDADEQERRGRIHLADDILSNMAAYVSTLIGT